MRNPLKGYRDAKGLTQQQLADKLKVSRALVGMLETGEKPFTVNMCLLIERKLGILRERIRPDLFIRKPVREPKFAT